MLRAILVDDEVNNLEALTARLARHTPHVHIIDACTSAEAGIRAIRATPPDLLFLDIEMPVMNGFRMLQQLEHRDFEVIFVTAFGHYALQAIKYSALDYLVKPVDPDELKVAVSNAEQSLRLRQRNQRLELLLEQVANRSLQRLALPTADGLLFIPVTDILFLRANANYTDIFLNDAHYLVSKPLKEYEELLPADTFLRIHHSHMINVRAVNRYIRGDGGQVVLSNGTVLDVSKRKKAEFLQAVANLPPNR